MFDQYKAVKSGTMPTGVSGVSVSVVFDSDNSLKSYYIFDNGVSPSDLDLKYYIDGKKATLKHSSAGYYLEVANISSNQLGTPHKFTVSGSSGTYDVSASVLTYARGLALNSNENKQNLAKAIYLYNQAAIAYVSK